MAEATTYNGWANYQTWAVGMFLDGNYDGEGIYRHALEVIEEAAQAGKVGRSTAIADVADALRELVEESVSVAVDGLASGLAVDLLGSAVGSVDWRELAESRLESVSFYTADELAGWETAAAELGREYAENAARWATDGNSDPAERGRVLANDARRRPSRRRLPAGIPDALGRMGGRSHAGATVRAARRARARERR
jgi:hypothetical protein